jgi:hypothetical protein
MLFYIFLFAVSQEHHRQRAWARSFGLWLVVEVVVVSSAIVFFTHVLVPSFIMTDVSKIRTRLIESLQEYHKTMNKFKNTDRIHEENDHSDTDEDEEKEGEKEGEKGKRDKGRHGVSFNAASYLFLSTKMAKLYPELKVAQIIQAFSTPWPKQSYHRASDVTKQYDRRFQAIVKSIQMVIMFFVTSFISIPPSFQDMVIHMSTTAISGYTALLHVHLYRIYPVLVAVPTLLIAAILHFFVQSNKQKGQLEFARLFGQGSSGNNKVHIDTNDKLVGAKDKDMIKEEEEISSKPSDVQHLNRRQSVALGISIANKAMEVVRNADFHAFQENDTESGNNETSMEFSSESDDYDLSTDSSDVPPAIYQMTTPSPKLVMGTDLKFTSLKPSLIFKSAEDVPASSIEESFELSSDSDSPEVDPNNVYQGEFEFENLFAPVEEIVVCLHSEEVDKDGPHSLQDTMEMHKGTAASLSDGIIISNQWDFDSALCFSSDDDIEKSSVSDDDSESTADDEFLSLSNSSDDSF